MKRSLIVIFVALMAVGGSVFLARAEEHGQAKALKLSQVPPAVQKVIKQEAAKHPLDSISMGDDEDARVYEGKFRDGARMIELKVASNGRVVSRELEQNHREDREEPDD